MSSWRPTGVVRSVYRIGVKLLGRDPGRHGERAPALESRWGPFAKGCAPTRTLPLGSCRTDGISCTERARSRRRDLALLVGGEDAELKDCRDSYTVSGTPWAGFDPSAVAALRSNSELLPQQLARGASHEDATRPSSISSA